MRRIWERFGNGRRHNPRSSAVEILSVRLLQEDRVALQGYNPTLLPTNSGGLQLDCGKTRRYDDTFVHTKGVPLISAVLATKGTIKKAAIDGNCAYHVLSLAVNQRLYSPHEVKKVREALISAVRKWVLGKELSKKVMDGAAPPSELDQALDKVYIQRLRILGLLTDHDLYESTNRALRRTTYLTVGWAHRNVATSIMKGLLGIPMLSYCGVR